MFKSFRYSWDDHTEPLHSFAAQIDLPHWLSSRNLVGLTLTADDSLSPFDDLSKLKFIAASAYIKDNERLLQLINFYKIEGTWKQLTMDTVTTNSIFSLSPVPNLINYTFKESPKHVTLLSSKRILKKHHYRVGGNYQELKEKGILTNNVK